MYDFRNSDCIQMNTIADYLFIVLFRSAANEHADPLTANLVNLGGQRWQNLRTKPALATSKIQHIFGLIAIASESFKTLHIITLYT